MAAVNPKVSVRGEHNRIGQRFGHSHEARIGETHRHVSVLVKQPENPLDFVTKIEAHGHGASSEKSGQSRTSLRTQQVKRLGQHRLTREPRRREAS